MDLATPSRDNGTMKKTKILIVGSGWRSLYYVRIIRALPQYFELCAMLCRTEEKAKRMEEIYGIRTSTSVEGCIAMSPDIVVVAVDKAHIAQVSMEWAKRGFLISGETPSAMDIGTLKELWDLHQKGSRIFFAEQYHLNPSNIARKKILQTGCIGKTDYLYLSLAHEYHGISLMRSFLDIDVSEPFKISARRFSFETRKTLDRYQRYRDGSTAFKDRVLALFEFQNGKVCAYDFDSEQYRSPIRNDLYKIQGVKGELCNDELVFLDEHGDVRTYKMNIVHHTVHTDDENPNLKTYEEIDAIALDGRLLYEAPFGRCGLSEDETAVALHLLSLAEGKDPYPLREALQDAYMAICLRKAAEEGITVPSESLPWQY